MNKTMLTLTLTTVGLLTAVATGLAISDDDHREHRRSTTPRADVDPVTNSFYAEECGSCHMAYQPGLLPARSWNVIMTPAALADHFGDDASLPDESREAIGRYLSANAADFSDKKRSRSFAKAALGEMPDPAGGGPRITENRYFVRKHDEIPLRLVTGNPEVGSFSQCDSCHGRANDGVYNEHDVVIPGHGRWED
ncbi:diheme cytochrome c [Thioalkalicoccus limnaeus]|uniref:Diheme cytochrome c n=1 Tax=Thioalkalicoccus limnaeus TaxID=120681 RepID=A0ABV4BD60_9GAMM